MFFKLECKAAILNDEILVYTEKTVQPFQLPIALDKCVFVTSQCSISHLVITHQAYCNSLTMPSGKLTDLLK